MQNMKRRALVLSSENAGHWFRRSLPAHVFNVLVGDDEDTVANAATAKRWRLSGGDWRTFMAAYCASFCAITVFIA